jgi:hypothetical protein
MTDTVGGSGPEPNEPGRGSEGSGEPSLAFPDGVLVRKVDDEMVLLNLRTEQYYGLDLVGADIVDRLTSAPMDQALTALCSQFEVDATVLRADVERLVGELLDAGLLERTHRL